MRNFVFPVFSVIGEKQFILKSRFTAFKFGVDLMGFLQSFLWQTSEWLI